MHELFPALRTESAKTALRFGDREFSYATVAADASRIARSLGRLAPGSRVAVWATSGPETVVGVLGALLAGFAAVPINPKIGHRELEHIVSDSQPARVLSEAQAALPDALGTVPREEIQLGLPGPATPAEPEDGEAAGLIVYTSGTTGTPKGVLIPRRAIAATLDAIAEVWQWSSADVLVHALPLFHVHGLILGALGPVRRGGTVHHLGTFSPEGVRDALASEASMLFGVPTMYHRLADALPGDPGLADAMARARLLVSGSAALPVHDHERIAAATGQRVVERYGLTETLMNTSVRLDGKHRPGTVGAAVPGVSLRLVDEQGVPFEATDDETIGEIEVSGDNLFSGYLNRPEATAEVFDGTWFRTGDMATRDAAGRIRIVGRKSTDIIKCGGYKIGAVEVENALLEHPGVAEAAVTPEPDPDLGERVVAWIVPDGDAPGEQELIDHVACLLSPHKRPRSVRVLDALPRNDMGKVTKRALTGSA